jgi:D-serine deaminase-like pyridoxal phosphate-dependent protein
MPLPPPAAAGMPLAEVDTPALLLDLDAFERNVATMADAARGLRLRPHAKSHKCPEIALRQIAAGAVGVCCQKVSEAQAMVDGGVGDVLVSNEVVGGAKLARLAALAKRARVSVCVDAAANAGALDDAARAAGVRLDVLVEVDVGAGRCGVEPGEPALRLARAVAGSRHLRFAGIHAYHGAAQHLRSVAERSAAIALAAEKARRTRDLLEDEGLECESVTGAGTGTFPFERESGVWTELQPGSYVFMDADYGRNEWEAPGEGKGSPGISFPRFEQSLYIWSTVMSTPAPGRAIVDAGLKAHSFDSGNPLVAGRPGVEYVRGSDEHGMLKVASGARAPVLGEKLRLIPGHCDPTVNLYDWLVCYRGERVEALWPVAARGAFY